MSTGLSYKATNKLTLKVGADVNLPNWVIDNKTEITYDGTTEERKEVSTVKTSDAEFKAPNTDFNLTWNSGFRFDLTENVAFDCNYNVVGDLFTTNFTAPRLVGNFWTSIGSICFHQLDFLVSVKF